ncbi:MAG TPA: VWA domain-containing protein [Vicinamibacterales bacterium]|nr:VWA domain-containing protein [Vicinamibacterales bacterium]
MTNPRSCAMLALAAVGALPVVMPAQEKQVFHAATDVVSVSVSVRAGRSPVTGLTAADFELTDNGVRQDIAISIEQIPIDLTLLLDTSPSTADAIEKFRSGAQQIATLLRSQDRVRLITFATEVTEIFPFRTGGEPMPVEAVTVQGGTSLHDALVLALARGPIEGRRHLVVAFTDGHDTTSVADGETLAFVAARADGELHLVLSGAYGTDYTQPPAVRSLRQAAEQSGGELHPPGRFNSALDAFKRVVDDFRQSYVLRYTVRGVKREGWHALEVKLKKAAASRYTLHARKGYFGG